MNDEELVLALIKLGFVDSKAMCWHALLDNKAPVAVFTSVESLVRDWRVAGALMEKCEDIDIGQLSDNNWAVTCNDRKATQAHNESLPRAIIEACCEVLQRKS